MRIPRIVLAVLLVGTPVAGVIATTSAALAEPFTYSSVDITDGTACALTSDGTAMCWGSNRNSWLIGGSRDEVIDLPTPVRLPNDDHFVSLNGGGNHTWCGLAESGIVYCWGEHHLGNYFIATSTSPVPVQFPTSTPITTVGSGYAIGCALNTNNELWCWGDILETGSGETESMRTPVLVSFPNNEYVTSFDLGGIPCAITNAGNVYCWAHENGAGQLGIGYPSSIPYAVSVVPHKVLTPAGLQFVSVNSGYEHVCALTNTGVGYCWGDNYDGLFGNNTYLDSSTPSRMLPPNDEPIAQISTTSYHTCILTVSNKTFCVGNGDNGMFGTGTTLGGKTYRSPVLPAGIYFTHIATSGSGTCGLDQNNAVWCFGLLTRFLATSTGSAPSLFPTMIPAVGSPTVVASTLANIGAESVIIRGSVNGNGYATTTRIEYDTEPTFSHPQSVPVVATIRDRSYASVVISNEIDSLEPRTSYYARLVAINSLGTTYSNVLTFTTVGDIPVVDEPVITNITGNEAHVALSVHPGLLATRSTLQFSTQPNCSLDCTSLPLPTITGTAAHFLDATLTQLHAQTQYFVSVTSSNKLGTVTSTVTTFSTIGSLANGTISSPSVSNTTLTASIAVDTGLLAGSVALEVSATDTFDSIISSTSSAFSSNGPLTHLLTVTGLSAHTNYFIRAAANNELGTTYSVVLPIRTLGGIPVLEYPVASADLQSATLSGDLRTTGLDTFVTAALSTNPDMSQSTEFFVYAGSISHTISLTLHHLASRTTYYATLTASNEMGSSTTAVIPITTRTPVGVLINSGAASTASSTVSLDFTTPTNIAAIRISNYADFSQARVFGAASALDWALLPSNESSALRTVWVQFVLTTGRTVEFSDTITLTATTDPGVSPINNAGTSIVATSKSAAPTISATTTATRTAPITRIVTIKVRKTSSSIVRMQTKTGKKIVTRRISVNKSGKYVIAIPAGVKTMMVRLIDATGKVSNWTSVA